MPVAIRVITWARVSRSMRIAAAASTKAGLAGLSVTQYWAIRNTISTM